MGRPVVGRRLQTRGGYSAGKTSAAAEKLGVDPTALAGVENAAWDAAWAACPTGPVVETEGAIHADAPWKEVYDRVFEENLPVA